MHMDKLTAELEKLETTFLHSNEFITAKVTIQKMLMDMQDDLYIAANFNITEVLTTWRRLGGAEGTLSGYVDGVQKLQTLIEDIKSASHFNI